MKSVFLWLLFVLLGAVVFSKALGQVPHGAQHTPNGVNACARKLASGVSGEMSPTTARRVARQICVEWRDGSTERRYFYRSFVR